LLVDLSGVQWSVAEKEIIVNHAQMPTINLTTYPIAAQAIAALQAKGVTVQVKTT
jgi:hypothetical protein